MSALQRLRFALDRPAVPHHGTDPRESDLRSAARTTAPKAHAASPAGARFSARLDLQPHFRAPVLGCYPARVIALSNSGRRYGAVAILLHWGMAALLIGLIALGIYMVRLPDVGFDKEKITLILVHKALGMIALGILGLRVLWRIANALPHFVDGLPDWQRVSAIFVHLWMYALMFALPVTGWLMSSAGGYPTPVFGWFDVPDVIPRNEALFQTLIDVHRWLGYAFGVLVVMHSAAALRHHFVRKDDTLRKMLPGV
jgi:cytochrome b561